MKFFKNIIINFLLFFREVFVYHHKSLEFRAMVFTAVIGANKNHGDCEDIILSSIAHEIYKNDDTRVKLLLKTVKEYLDKIKQGHYDIEDFVAKIDNSINEKPKLAQKIDLYQLRKFCQCDMTHACSSYQIKMIDFLDESIIHYNKEGK